MISFFKKIFLPSYQPLNQLIIDKNQLLKNFETLKIHNDRVEIAPVLKSNAYGHGLLQIASILDTLDFPFYCVDSVYEAFFLRKNGIKKEILVMGAIDLTRLEHKSLPFQLTIIDSKYIDLFQKYQPNAKVHLFVDTGMNREGVRIEELDNVLEKLKASSLQLGGVMTHLAIAKKPDHPLTKLQITNFAKAKEMVEKAGFTPKWWHIGGSDALSWINPKIANLVRCGRLIYGVESSLRGTKQSQSTLGIDHNLRESTEKLRLPRFARNDVLTTPILSLTSTVVQIKNVKKGESVGYDATYKASKDLTIAILPIGYNDGVDKRLSNQGFALIQGVDCPILGLISMNMCVVDVTNLKDPKIGEKATIISADPKAKNSIENIAQIVNTNPSNILVGLNASIRREIKSN